MTKRIKILNLSVPLEACPTELLSAEIVHVTHEDNVEDHTLRFGCNAKNLPSRLAHADDKLRTSAHIGTHVDAPRHYFPKSQGKKARTIDERCLWNGFIMME